MRTILITGAGGYIGTTLTDMLLEKGYRVLGYDRYFFGKQLFAETLEHKNFVLIQKDIRECEVDDFIDVDCVCDLAALSNDPTGDLDPGLTRSINYKGRSRIAEKAKQAGVTRYILGSSCSVYGNGQGTMLTESSPVHPLTEYAMANYDAEKTAFELASSSFCVTALRQATLYGLSKRMRFDLALNIMTLHAVQKGCIRVLGGGEQWRPFLHVRDTARAFMIILEAALEKVNQQIFNVGSNEQNYKILTLAYIIRENIPFPLQVEVMPGDKDKRNYKVSFDKIHDILGFSCRYSLEDGVREIYQALKRGSTNAGLKTLTVGWYKYLLEMEDVIEEIQLEGKLLR